MYKYYHDNHVRLGRWTEND